MLNQYQFDAVKAGDWFCECHNNERSNSPFAYFWNKEVAPSTPVAAQGQPEITVSHGAPPAASPAPWVTGEVAHSGAVSSGYLRELDMKRSAEAAQGGTQETTKEPDDLMREILRLHWLSNIECLHIIRSDIAHCACGWKSSIQPTVGAAVERWIDHLAEAGAAASQDTTKENR